MHYNGYLFLYSVRGGADTNEGTRSVGTATGPGLPRGPVEFALVPHLKWRGHKEASATLLAIWATAANLRERDNR